ncbi:MAG: iron-containing alcohol dehydrogenase [Candidatus Lernaella stagnicola]|nr:iron-containing alcohol dehydrogenase [Candidatus Lernaella stagnicola]
MEPIIPDPFEFACGPKIIFGAGRFAELPALLATCGKRVLCLTGEVSFKTDAKWGAFHVAAAAQGVRISHVAVGATPSDVWVDEICAKYRDEPIDTVVGIGGGRVVDSAKLVAVGLAASQPMRDWVSEAYRERLPLVVVPTTSGVGAEVSPAVVYTLPDDPRRVAEIRHDHFAPDLAVIDPELMLGCPLPLSAAAGLTALTHLLESYVSRRANALSDAIAFSGVLHLRESFPAFFANGEDTVLPRANLAYASLLAGIARANAGSGVVHGLALQLAGRHGISYGVACGTLLPVAVGVNIHVLRHVQPDELILAKYAMLGHLFSGLEPADINAGCDALITTLNDWINVMQLPRLGDFGVETDVIADLAAATDVGDNAVEITNDDVKNIIQLRI